MARNINTITVSGNITRDPELRFTPSGQGVTTFGVAVNRCWQNRLTLVWEEQTSFFAVK
jgi:single-strand DNA-binding protein